MHKLFKHIQNYTAVGMAVLVMLSTSGFRMYSHSCHHKHTKNYSLFIPVQSCQKQHSSKQNNSCCKPMEKTQQCSACDSNEASADSCCTNGVSVFKLKTPTLLTHTLPELKVSELSLFMACVLFDAHYKSISPVKNLAYSYWESPPPQNVHSYLAKIQVYRI